jgi:hypothetical protein
MGLSPLQVNFPEAGRNLDLNLCLQMNPGDEMVGRGIVAEVRLPYNYKVEPHTAHDRKVEDLMGTEESFGRDQLYPDGAGVSRFFLGQEGRNCWSVKGKRSNFISNENGTFIGWAFVNDYQNAVGRKRARKFFQAPSNVPITEIQISSTAK